MDALRSSVNARVAEKQRGREYAEPSMDTLFQLVRVHFHTVCPFSEIPCLLCVEEDRHVCHSKLLQQNDGRQRHSDVESILYLPDGCTGGRLISRLVTIKW